MLEAPSRISRDARATAESIDWTCFCRERRPCQQSARSTPYSTALPRDTGPPAGSS